MTRPLTIGVVAPSGYPADPQAAARGMQRLRQLGHEVRDLTIGHPRHQRFAADDAGRIAQLYAAASDPQVELVIALRGGYGLSRLLAQIDFARIAASGKRWVGHSDFTAFQMGLLAIAGAGSFAGPMICDDFSRSDPSDFTLGEFWRCLGSRTLTIRVDHHRNPELQASGQLWGGNLAMLCHLVGSRWMPAIDGGILFVEDINEHPYRIERMLLQLDHAGILARQQAIVLGDFSGYRLTEADHGYNFDTMLDYLRDRLPVPILCGLPFGHTRDKLMLPVGAACVLRSGADGFTLDLSGYPALDLD